MVLCTIASSFLVTRSWSVPVKIPRGFDSRRDEVTLRRNGDEIQIVRLPAGP